MARGDRSPGRSPSEPVLLRLASTTRCRDDVDDTQRGLIDDNDVSDIIDISFDDPPGCEPQKCSGLGTRVP
ncbi:MAG: hypothetical protein CME06_01685 [Gemmatimonadetes bacterium]|nr:hypothetical protein [Gemmatimonadota bacterium]